MITILCPTYNEIAFIDGLLDFLVNVTPEDKEVLIIDGGSDDGTPERIQAWQANYPEIKYLQNPEKIVPFALNRGIAAAKGDPVVRIDAHTVYADDYFTRILETFEEVNADIVGGPTRTACSSPVQCAVANAICSKFGIGGSLVHQLNFKGYVDSVTFGAWRKSIFQDTGKFDTNLKRNQDDEFHYRAKSLGKTIFQNPDIKLWYYPRDNFKGLFRQYFQYGLYKPLVLKKIKSEAKLRHLIPSLFVLYLLTMPLAMLFTVYLLPLVLYLLLDVYFSFKNNDTIKAQFSSLLVYPVLHISYGVGFLLGLFKRA